MIYWLIGQPGSGKTTLATKLKETLRTYDGIIHIDGDGLRKIFDDGYAPETFTKPQRVAQTKVLQKLIAYIADQDVDVIVSTVNAYRDIREDFKAERFDLIEIYVHRDGERIRKENDVNDFEPPLKDFIDVDTTGKTVNESLDELCKKL